MMLVIPRGMTTCSQGSGARATQLLENAVREAEHEPARSRDEDAEQRTLVRVGLEQHRTKESGGEANPPDDECGSNGAQHHAPRSLSEHSVFHQYRADEHHEKERHDDL